MKYAVLAGSADFTTIGPGFVAIEKAQEFGLVGGSLKPNERVADWTPYIDNAFVPR